MPTHEAMAKHDSIKSPEQLHPPSTHHPIIHRTLHDERKTDQGDMTETQDHNDMTKTTLTSHNSPSHPDQEDTNQSSQVPDNTEHIPWNDTATRNDVDATNSNIEILHIPSPKPPENSFLTQNENSTDNVEKCQPIQNEEMHLTGDKVDKQQEGRSNPMEITIIGHRAKKSGMQYLLKNQGEHDAEAIWVDEHNIENTDLVNQYRKDHLRTPSERKHKSQPDQTTVAALYPKASRPYLPLSQLPITLIFMAAMAPAFEAPDLGPLFNYDRSKRSAAFIFPININCSDPKDHKGIKRYEANVLSYHEHFTDIWMH